MDMYIYIKEEIKERQYRLFVKHTGAGLDGTGTHNHQVSRPELYHLSYVQYSIR